MATLLERLRRALAADYDIEHELASGGMGIVYRARDRHLDRPVAVKIIRPDLATAAGAERFVREARLIAACQHPNVVQIHRAGQADGIGFYVMEYLRGETVAERLARGAMPPGEVRRLADDLLAALDAVHTSGVVHRDVKPSNVFLVGGRAVLSDFGISKGGSSGAEDITQPGAVLGTPGYMPPEQYAGADVTPAADVCAAAMVVYQAYTGRPWVFDSTTDQADWRGVPDVSQPALRRALAWNPGERFTRAGEFRTALATMPGRTRRRAWWWGAAAAAIGLVAVVARTWPPPRDTGAVQVQIGALVPAAGAPSGLGDSVRVQMLRALRGAADIAFSSAAAGTPADLEVAGGIAVAGDSLVVTLQATSPGEGVLQFARTVRASPGAVAESAARELLLAIWSTRDAGVRDLPVAALPHTPAGLALWAQAEALYARAQWGAAVRAYDEALRADASCALCRLRLVLLTRWLRTGADPAHAAALRSGRNVFSPPYQAVIRATLDSGDRWQTFERLVQDYPRFDLGHFVFGDELFHRGPLSGRNRREASERFATAVNLRPGFAPALEHQAWAAIADGDSALAQRALARFEQAASADDPETFVVRTLLQLGFAWRFGPPGFGAAVSEQAMSHPAIASLADLRWGPRFMLVFDEPEMVLWFGRRFTRPGAAPELRTPGLVAVTVAQLALGRTDSALAAIDRLRAESDDAEYTLAAAGFETMLALFDTLGAGRRAALEASLAAAAREAGAPLQRHRAAWMMALLARQAGADARSWRAQLAGEPRPAPFGTLLDADSVARTDPRGALGRSRPLLALDSAGQAGDPFFRAVLHLKRAAWFQQAGDSSGARRELLWASNYDVVGQPSAPLQAEDADWALGTVARWRAGTLARWATGREATGPAGNPGCRDLADVARLWRTADARLRLRADSAAALHGRHCPR